MIAIKHGKDLVKELDFLRGLDKEEFYVYFFRSVGNKYEVIHKKCYSVSSKVDSVHVFPEEIFKDLLNMDCKYFVMVHNHPNEKFITPSEDDLYLTNGMSSTADWLGMKMLDSLIIGDNDAYFSFDEYKLIGKTNKSLETVIEIRLDERFNRLCKKIMELKEMELC